MKKSEKILLSIAAASLMAVCGVRTFHAIFSEKENNVKPSTLLDVLNASVQWLQITNRI